MTAMKRTPVLRLSEHSLLLTFAIWGAFARFALATLPPPYDFTGQWSGTATSRGVIAPVSVDFIPTANPRRFTGSGTIVFPKGTVTCQVNAIYRKNLKLHGRCGRKTFTTAAHLDTTLTPPSLRGSLPVGTTLGRLILTFTLMKVS